MKKIYKYQLEVLDHQTLSMPVGAEVLTVQTQWEVPCIWALIDSEEDVEEDRIFLIFGTGHPIPKKLNYIGTFQMQFGTFVWHLFEQSKI